MLRAKTPKLLTGVATVTVIAFGVAYAQQGPRGNPHLRHVNSSQRNRRGFAASKATAPASGRVSWGRRCGRAYRLRKGDGRQPWGSDRD